MIKSFASKETAALFCGRPVRQLPHEMLVRAKARLDQLDAAQSVEDLRLPPSNQLHRLSGERKSEWSLRVNNQWRVCFEWIDGDAWNVQIIDYH